MLTKKLRTDDPDFKWLGGANQEPERQALIRTIELASELQIENPAFVELGTFKGIKARNFIVALNKLNCVSKFFSVDLNPFIKHLNFYPRVEWEKRCNDIEGVCVAKFLEGQTVDMAPLFKDSEIAWLFVDACHCYECVSSEIMLYTPKLAVGSFMLFHDTKKRQDDQWIGHNPPRKYGVLKAIEESQDLKNQFKLLYETRAHHGTQVWQKVT